MRLAAFLVGDLAVAEEIVQDAFLEVARRWDRLDTRPATCGRRWSMAAATTAAGSP